jgi:hypothetical protein
LTSSVLLENNGSFTGILTIGAQTGTITTPTLTCTGPGGTVSTIPGSVTAGSGPGSTLTLAGTSNGSIITFSQDTQTEFCAGMTTCSLSGTVVILATNVEITLNGTASLTVAGGVSNLTLTFSLTKQ